jgi:hypothetical protein
LSNVSRLSVIGALLMTTSAVAALSAGTAAAQQRCGLRLCQHKSPPPPPQGSCQPSSSLSVLVQGTDVTAYVPKGNWGSSATGISVVNVEGTSIKPTKVPTGTDAINSCASNPVTGQTVCAANNNHVYVLKGTAARPFLTSGGSGNLGFSGGHCTNCSALIAAS